MAQSYDLDHAAAANARALRQIRARIDGVWDDPDLLALGPLGELRFDLRRILAEPGVDPDPD